MCLKGAHHRITFAHRLSRFLTLMEEEKYPWPHSRSSHARYIYIYVFVLVYLMGLSRIFDLLPRSVFMLLFLTDHPVTIFIKLGEEMDQEDARDMIALADTDGNGLVRFEEFYRLMMTTCLFS